jgi:hypothetical protein
MNKIKYFSRKSLLGAALLMLGAAIFTQCYKDNGNYKYIQLDEATIDVSGTNIQQSYAIFQYDTINITPKVFFKGTQVNETHPQLDFYWVVYSAATGIMAQIRDTVSRSITLNEPLGHTAGLYILLFTVTNKETGVSVFHTLYVTIINSLSAGWLVFYETKEGGSDMGLIINNWMRENYSGPDRVFMNTFSYANGRQLKGKPVSIYHSVDNIENFMIVATDEEANWLKPATFGIHYAYKDRFWEMPAAEERIQYVGGAGSTMQGRRTTALINNKVYAMGQSIRDRFGLPHTGNHGTLADWMCDHHNTSAFQAIVYDQTNKRFLCVPSGGSSITGFATQDMETAAFDVNNVGMEMLFSDFGHPASSAITSGMNITGYEYSIMKNGAEYVLLVSNFAPGQNSTTSNRIGIGKYNMSSCPEISNTTSMAAGGYGEYIYYSTAKKLYLFRFSETNPYDTEQWTAPEGEVITHVRMHKHRDPIATVTRFYGIVNAFEILNIATWNESTQTGTVYQLRITRSTGAIDTDIEGNRYTGFGKIGEMGLKWI